MVKEKLQSLGGGDWEDQLAEVNKTIKKHEESFKKIDLLREVPTVSVSVYEDEDGNLIAHSNEKTQEIGEENTFLKVERTEAPIKPIKRKASISSSNEIKYEEIGKTIDQPVLETQIVNQINLGAEGLMAGSRIHLKNGEEVQIDGIATDGDHNLVYYRTIKKSPMGDVKISDSKNEAEFTDMISSKGGVLIKDYTVKARGEKVDSANLNEQHGSSNEQPKSDTIVNMVKETPKIEPVTNPVNDTENFADTKKDDIENLLDEHKKYLNNKFNNAKTEEEKTKLEKKIKYFNDSPYVQLKSNIEYSIKNLEEKIATSKTKGEGNSLKRILSRLQVELALVDEAIKEEELKNKEANNKKTVKPKGDAENATRKVGLRPMTHTLKTPDGSVYELRDLTGTQIELFKAILSDIETSQISREEIIALNERMDDEVKLPEKSLTDLLYAFDIKNPKKETHEEIAENLGIPAELPGLAEAQAELDIEKQKKEFMALVQEFNVMKASYEAKMARIAELDKIIEENKNNPGTVVTNEVAEPVNPETNLEDLSDEELARREQELEKEIAKNNTQETQDIEKYHVILGNGNFTVRIKNWEEIKEGKKNISTEDPDGVWLVTGEDGSIIADNVGGKEAEEIYNKAVEEFAATYKKNDIKRRRQEELKQKNIYGYHLGTEGTEFSNVEKRIKNEEDNVKNASSEVYREDAQKRLDSFKEIKSELEKINAKYDAELAALENDKPSSENAEVENYEKPFIPEGMWTSTPDKISHVNEKGEEFKLGDEIYQTPAQGNAPIYEYLGRITGFDDKFAYITSRNDTVDKRPINTDVLVKKVPDGFEIVGK